MASERVCVEFGSSAVKVVVGKYRDGKFFIYRCGMKEYGKELDSFKAMIHAFYELMMKMGLKRAVIHSVVGAEVTLYRYAMFSDVDISKLRALVECEGIRYVPSTFGDALIEPLLFSNDRRRKLKEPILLVAVKKNFVNRLENEIYRLGYRIRFLSIDAIVLAKLFQFLYPLEDIPVCVVDIGKLYTTIFVIDEGKINFIRTTKLGGYDVDLLIRDRLDVSLEMASEIKCGKNAIVDILTLANKVFLQFVDEIYVSIDYYESQTGRIPEKVVLTGGIANLKGLREFVSSRLDTEVEIFNLPESQIVFENREWKSRFTELSGRLLPSVGMFLV